MLLNTLKLEGGSVKDADSHTPLFFLVSHDDTMAATDPTQAHRGGHAERTLERTAATLQPRPPQGQL